MPRYDEVKDEQARSLLAQAQSELRAGKGLEAVRTTGDAFLRLVELKPDLLQANLPVEGEMPHFGDGQAARFPQNGAMLAVQAGRPVITIERPRFSTSEAVIYYEFALTTALEAGL